MEENCICKFCGSLWKNLNSLRNHERLCPKNPDRKYVSHTIGHTAWNKGKTKDSDECIRGYAETFSKRYRGTEEGKKILSHPHSEEFKKKMREMAFQRELGGWHTSKTVEYKGVKLDSKYEYEVAKNLDENHIEWKRPSYLIWEDDDGIKHRYYPDFYLPEFNVYLDPKNDYLINSKSKRFGITDFDKISKVQQQNGVKIIILDKNHLTWNSIKERI